MPDIKVSDSRAMRATLHLPLELWLLAFQLVTDTPGLYNTSILPPLSSSPRSWDDHDTVSNPETHEYNLAVHTKYCITLVSRLWNRLALGLLYEHVLIRGPEALSSIVLAVRNGTITDEGSSEGTRQYRTRHTRRLDITYSPRLLCSSRREIEEVEEEYYGGIAELLSQCPKLNVLHLAVILNWHISAQPLIRIFERGCNNLRHLRWNSDTENLPLCLPCLPLLEVLEIHADSHRDSELGGPTTSLPHLHTLIIYDMGQLGVADVVGGWDLPSLKHLILRVKFEPDEYSDEIRILTVFGVQMAHLDIADCDFQNIHHQLSRCPNLTELSISADAFEDVATLLPVERVSVTLEVYDGQAASARVKKLDGCMIDLYNMQLPKLKAVRLADLDHKRIKEHLKLKPTLRGKVKEWIGKWSERDVRFEDPDGWLLSERPIFQEASEPNVTEV